MADAYVCQIRVVDATPFFLWVSGDDQADSVLTHSNGTVAIFREESEARAYAQSRGLTVSLNPAQVYDLVGLEEWCDNPDTATLDCSVLLNHWNLFTDVIVESPDITSLFGHEQRGANSVYDKLFFGCNLPAVTPHGSTY